MLRASWSSRFRREMGAKPRHSIQRKPPFAVYAVGMRFSTSRMLFRGLADAVIVVTASAALGQAAATPPGDSKTPAVTEPHFPTNEELRHLKTMGAPLLSPDGKQVLFSV